MDDDGKTFSPGTIRLRAPAKLATTTYVNELAERLNAQGSPFTLGEDGPDGEQAFVFPAAIQGGGTNEVYTCAPQLGASGSVTAAWNGSNTTGLTGAATISVTNLAERNATNSAGTGTHWLASGTRVIVAGIADRDGKLRFVTSLLPPSCFLCSVTSTTGSGGGSAALSSFVYDVAVPGVITLHGLTNSRRLGFGNWTAAKLGVFYPSGSGTNGALDAFESAGTAGCS